MKKIFISPELHKNKYGEIQLSIRKDYFEYFENLNIDCYSSFSFQEKKIKEIANKSNGLVISGGGNIFKIEKKKINLIRDKFEKKLLKEFLKRKKPILAICRGFQLIADFNKFKIYKIKNHVKKNHLIKIIKKNKFIKCNMLKTNSFHNLAVRDLKKDFQINGISIDGNIEIATNLKKKCLCFMFHPERKNVSKKAIDQIIINFFHGSNYTSSRSR